MDAKSCIRCGATFWPRVGRGRPTDNCRRCQYRNRPKATPPTECKDCRGPMGQLASDKGPYPLYCAACALKRKRKTRRLAVAKYLATHPDVRKRMHDANAARQRAKRMQARRDNPRTDGRCVECGKPTGRGYLAWYCADCKSLNIKLKERHHMTAGEYLALLELQKGVCAICLRPPTAHRLAIDHCHTTGKIRGLLCTKCNLGLGGFHDNRDHLLRAAEYLTR